jgi:hypothetical protein
MAGCLPYLLLVVLAQQIPDHGAAEMKNKLLLSFASVVGLLTVCGPVFAHHGSAAYADKMIVLKQATVTKFAWANPHSIVMFDVKDDKGNDVHWAGEAGSPSALGLIGWSKSSVQPGDVITVYMFPARSGNPVGRLNKIILADGTELHDSQLGGDKYGADKPAK